MAETADERKGDLQCDVSRHLRAAETLERTERLAIVGWLLAIGAVAIAVLLWSWL